VYDKYFYKLGSFYDFQSAVKSLCVTDRRTNKQTDGWTDEQDAIRNAAS